jgi:hypothetical protein
VQTLSVEVMHQKGRVKGTVQGSSEELLFQVPLGGLSGLCPDLSFGPSWLSN